MILSREPRSLSALDAQARSSTSYSSSPELMFVPLSDERSTPFCGVSSLGLQLG